MKQQKLTTANKGYLSYKCIEFIFFLLQGLLVEESSEIASARASSIYRKSFYKKGNKNNIVANKCKKQSSLSKISEEDSENVASRSSDNQVCDGKITKKLDDKELFSDKAITNSTSTTGSGNSENDMNQDEESDENESNGRNESKGHSVVSRFVPEMMNRYKITIV